MPVLVVQSSAVTNTEVQNMEAHTPAKMQGKTGTSAKSGRRFTEEEKAQLLENFDLEIADRVARMRANVTDILERFLIRQENEVTRIPRALRSLTIGDFADKYNGSISECLQGMAQARLESAQETDLAGGKRKWQGSQNAETAAADKEGSRAPKAARKAPPTTSTVRRIVPAGSRTPSTNRTLHSTVNPNPTPSRPRLNATPLRKAPALSRTGTVPASPFRALNGAQPGHNAVARSVSQPVIPTTKPPTSAIFAPTMPPSAPAYPRRPRRGEQMLSVNGSPLANPLDPDYDVAQDGQLERDGGKASRSPKPKPNHLSKTGSSIRVRPKNSRSATSFAIRHPSASSTSTLVSYDMPSSSSSTLNSQHSAKQLPSAPSTSQLQLDAPRTPTRIRRTASALVMLPTASGEVLELDPLVASPGAVDALEGISDSAKKMAKEEMVRFVTEAVAKWNVKIS
ncbi:Nbl1/borealin family, amino-terminal protein [Rhizoctonia solani 123E]|uniref:Nbl1/borealin family, amino-terminal protein n=1 Tax=Rhizoctonia solani 123E TaxID=1423351 RepID=A0A074RVC7_9AGAM|nr:Nbl1/borealin family, amino-terminal protein [Rhizoctonia solani 123E]